MISPTDMSHAPTSRDIKMAKSDVQRTFPQLIGFAAILGSVFSCSLRQAKNLKGSEQGGLFVISHSVTL